MPRFEYRDDQLAILWKPPGMAVQATRGSVHGTLEAWLREQRRVRYCAFHHRLDRDARGLLAVALHRSANRGLAEAFSQRTVRRRYRILVHGRPVGEEGSWRHRERVEGRDRSAQPWTDDGKGREMSARWSLLEQRGSRSLLEVQLATGRTHQIRLQAAAEGLPVVGDRLYGFGERSGLRLQAFSLELAHPVTGEAVACVLEEPSDWLRGPGTPEP